MPPTDVLFGSIGGIVEIILITGHFLPHRLLYLTIEGVHIFDEFLGHLHSCRTRATALVADWGWMLERAMLSLIIGARLRHQSSSHESPLSLSLSSPSPATLVLATRFDHPSRKVGSAWCPSIIDGHGSTVMVSFSWMKFQIGRC